MEHTKKFALVPHALIQTLLGQQHLQNNAGEQLVELNERMQSVLHDRHTSEDVKQKLYDQERSRYTAVRNNELRVPRFEPASTMPSSDFIKTLPQQFQSKARQLYAHIANNPRFQFSENAELIYNERPIPESHIADLIYDLSKPKGRQAPKGSKEFVKLLKETNVPRLSIGNQDRWLQREAEETPPRRLEFDESMSEASTVGKNWNITPGKRRGRKQRGRGLWIPY